ncbi:MAG: hypothetical protein EPN85_10860 [Bacteroidetes bacterium]|nr:MAG: hypothetical protein EPN85_10860 [Bacteroidota bacterium]
MKFLHSVILILAIPYIVKAQNFGIGADIMYNFQTESFGAGVRGNFFPNRTLSIVPQFSYYPGFNKVHEYYLGLGLEYKFLRLNKFDFYAIGHGAYNSWINYASSAMDGARQTNWNLEGGLGVTTKKCLRPFLEYRYNLKFQETHLRLGLLYLFGCKGGGGGNKKGGGLCPAYN